MPPPRSCRSCGAAPSPDVRWCGQCLEPVRRFTARSPLHDSVPQPETVRRLRFAPATEPGTGGHYSRWERTSTTFGPAGRVLSTAAIGGWIVASFFTMFVVLWIVLVFVGGWVLREVWKKGWVPSEQVIASAAPAPSDASRPADGASGVPTWIPVRTRVAWVGVGVVVVAASLGIAYGSEDVQAFVLMGGAITLLVGWFGFVLRR